MADKHEKHTFSTDFKRFFGRGLAILLPSIITLWLLFQAFIFVFDAVAEPINRGIRGAVIWAAPRLLEDDEMPGWFVVTQDQVDRRMERRAAEGLTPMPEPVLRQEIRVQQYQDVWERHWYLNGLGLVVAIVLIYLAGLLLGNYLGRQIYTRVERLIAKIPGFKQVYPHVKQVVDLIFGENATMKAFREVVLVEYPGKDLWTVGLVTGSSFSQIRDSMGGDTITVFVPTSPTPMTGFVINVLRERTIKLDVTIEQALRWIITAGVLTPDQDLPPGAADERSRLARAQREAERAIAEHADEPGRP